MVKGPLVADAALGERFGQVLDGEGVGAVRRSSWCR